MRSEERDAKPNCQAVPSCKSNLCRELFPCWLGQRLLRVALTPQSEDEKFKLQSMSRPWSAKCESSIHLTCNGHPPGTLRTLSQSKPQSMRTSHQNSNPEHKPCGMAPSMLHSHCSAGLLLSCCFRHLSIFHFLCLAVGSFLQSTKMSEWFPRIACQ